MCSIRNLGAQLSLSVLSTAVPRKKLFVQQMCVICLSTGGFNILFCYFLL